MKDKGLIIGMICTIIVLMAVAFAAFSTSLTINGSASIDSNWKVSWDTSNITCNVTSEDSAKPSTCTLTKGESTISATMGWASPGDVITLTARVHNEGSLNATHKVSAKYHLTSNANAACTNVTATGRAVSYNAAGTSTGSTVVKLETAAQDVGPITILNKTSNATYHYGIYVFTFTYIPTSTSGAGSCTFTASGAATQTS